MRSEEQRGSEEEEDGKCNEGREESHDESKASSYRSSGACGSMSRHFEF